MAAANLVNQNEALMDFLDDLLTEAPDSPELEEQLEPHNEVAEIDALAKPSSEIPQQAVVEPPPPAPDIEDATGRKLIIPDWGRQPFAAMVFKVRDLSLAIPVQELAGVIDWQAARVEQQAGAMLLLGQTDYAGQAVKVVDTARFIFPDSKLAALAEQGGQHKLSRIVLINNGKIGLACDEVYELIDIQPSQVTWRSELTRRKWLAGTMLEEMIVLLDSATTADILADKLGL